MMKQINSIIDIILKKYNNKPVEIKKKSRFLLGINILGIFIFFMLTILEIVFRLPVTSFLPLALGFVFMILVFYFIKSGMFKLSCFLIIIGTLIFLSAGLIIDEYNNIFEIYRYSFAIISIIFVAGILSNRNRDVIFYFICGIIGILIFYFYRYYIQLGIAFASIPLISLAVCIILYTFYGLMAFFTMNITRSMVKEVELSGIEAKKDRDESLKMLNVIDIYTKPSIVQKVLGGENPTLLRPVKKELAVLFCDIRNFTNISENLEPLDVIEILNPYFAMMNSAIIVNNGELDKIMGDCIMAIFDKVDDALNAALEMKSVLADEKENINKIKNGIGIHYGEVIMGNIGSPWKLDYTVIGDVVNVASRLESLTKQYKVDIIISEQVKDNLNKSFTLEELDNITVRGRTKPIKIFQVKI
jgi:class 3 adenylate cyclase